MSSFFNSSYGRRGGSGGGGLVAAIIVGIFAVIFIGGCTASYVKTDKVTVLVKQKESVNTDDGHEYRIYTDHGTFVMKDSIVHPRFDTADEYAALDEGKRYDCEKFGFRIPVTSSFENLINCHEAIR